MRSFRVLTVACVMFAAPANADNLYRPGEWPALSSDRRASQAGDIVTVIVVQAAESSTTMQNSSRRATDLGGSISAGSISESGDIRFGGGYSGKGEVRRSERFLTQLTVTVAEVLPNGDLAIFGKQNLQINGEQTMVSVRGRIRTADLDGDNRVASNRIAEAQIDYKGRGFVTRSAKPGLLNLIFNFLGLG